MAALPGISRALLFSLALHAVWLWPRPAPETAARSPLFAHLRGASVPVLPVTEVAAARQHVDAAAVSASAPRSQPRAVAKPAVPAAVQAAPTLALPDAAAGADAGGLRAYRMALALGLQRAGAFTPHLAAGMRGRVEVLVSLSAQGQIVAIALEQSSGNTALDHLAMQAVAAVAPQTSLPVSLQGQTFSLVLALEVD